MSRVLRLRRFSIKTRSMPCQVDLKQAIGAFCGYKLIFYVERVYGAYTIARCKTLWNEPSVDFEAVSAGLFTCPEKASDETLEEVAANDPESQKVYDSFKKFLDSVSAWQDGCLKNGVY